MHARSAHCRRRPLPDRPQRAGESSCLPHQPRPVQYTMGKGYKGKAENKRGSGRGRGATVPGPEEEAEWNQRRHSE